MDVASDDKHLKTVEGRLHAQETPEMISCLSWSGGGHGGVRCQPIKWW